MSVKNKGYSPLLRLLLRSMGFFIAFCLMLTGFLCRFGVTDTCAGEVKISVAHLSCVFTVQELEKKSASFTLGIRSDGNVTCKKLSGSKYLSVTSKGRIKVKKGTPSGFYSIKLRISALDGAGSIPTSVKKKVSVEIVDKKTAFYAEEIPEEVYQRMAGVSYPKDCPVALDDLRYLHLLHKNKNGKTLKGEMVCNKAISEDLLEIFEELYDNGYPIERIALVDDYGGDDERSMTADNSSCFNFRYISGTTKISKHGYGMAVDINPLYNPYVKTKNGSLHIEPAAGEPYADRSKDNDYKIEEGDLCYRLFTQHGFEWGGNWNSVKDYQHFEKDFD